MTNLADKLAKLPEAIGPPISVANNRRPRLITAVHGPLRRSFSGITWHCGQTAMAEGVMEGAFALITDKINIPLHTKAVLWKLGRLVTGRKRNGYKYHPAYSDALWSQYLPVIASTTLISNSQVLGNYFFANCKRSDVTPCFYIDGTLTEYFYGYGAVEDNVVNAIGTDLIGRAITVERDGYQHAARIITMSQKTVTNLVEVYGVPPERISMVIPGANIDDDAAVPAPSTHIGWVGAEFTLGFIGLYPLRKGLDKLAEAVQILRARSVPIRLRVVGNCPDEIAAMDGVDFLGVINKASDLPRFIKTIRSVDLGCQLSRAELLGVAILEFLRVGVPIIATAVGGVPDVLEDGGGLLVSPDISAEQLAEELHTLITDTDRYQALRNAATQRSEWASWRRAVWQLDKTLADQ